VVSSVSVGEVYFFAFTLPVEPLLVAALSEINSPFAEYAIKAVVPFIFLEEESDVCGSKMANPGECE
jgi:hypothetical protein